MIVLLNIIFVWLLIGIVFVIFIIFFFVEVDFFVSMFLFIFNEFVFSNCLLVGI